jgi:hypothetical protein
MKLLFEALVILFVILIVSLALYIYFKRTTYYRGGGNSWSTVVDKMKPMDNTGDMGVAAKYKKLFIYDFADYNKYIGYRKYSKYHTTKNSLIVSDKRTIKSIKSIKSNHRYDNILFTHAIDINYEITFYCKRFIQNFIYVNKSYDYVTVSNVFYGNKSYKIPIHPFPVYVYKTWPHYCSIISASIILFYEKINCEICDSVYSV